MPKRKLIEDLLPAAKKPKTKEDDEKRTPLENGKNNTEGETSTNERQKTEHFALDKHDVKFLTTYGVCMFEEQVKKVQKDIEDTMKRIKTLVGVQESDSGLAAMHLWDLDADKAAAYTELPLYVARVISVLGQKENFHRYIVSSPALGKYVVRLGESLSPTDIEEGMRIGIDRYHLRIQIPLPPKIDPAVRMMEVDEKPDVTYADVGGCREQIEKLREIVETPLLHPEKFSELGIDPPRGALLFGPPGTGKTLCAKAVANSTDACFIRVIGSELVRCYIGEGARMVRDLFTMARSKKACVIFFDEIDAIGGTRIGDMGGSEREVHRTMLELITQLDGFDPRGNIKVLMASNRPDSLDPALMRPGRLDRKVEFGLPDLQGRTHVFKIHAKSMSVEKDLRYELLARLCPNTTGAEIRSICTEAGMFAIRKRKKTASEHDFLTAIEKVVKSYGKFSATPYYLAYN